MLAIIGGSGLECLDGFVQIAELNSDTAYGRPSAPIQRIQYENREFFFVSRHGKGHLIAPHRINYRANIDALSQLGVSEIVAVNAVGGITEPMSPQQLVIPDQLIDYSYGRDHTFFDIEPVRHIDFTQPFDPVLRQRLSFAAVKAGVSLIDNATYACTQGPRLETAAEVQRLKQDGCDIVGMTAMPEAALAREKGITYACLALVVNWAAGVSSDEPVSMDVIEMHMEQGMDRAKTVLKAYLKA